MSAHILLVEDDTFLREGLIELLTNESYKITAAENANKAKTYLNMTDFDLVVLDVRLPDGSGLDICREIRTDGKTVPVLFLTACDDENEIVTGLDSGADDYVTKPFGMMALVSRIKAALRRYEKNIEGYNNITEEQKQLGLWMFYERIWLFQRDKWTRKIWTPYVKEHYKFVEKEFDIIFKD